MRFLICGLGSVGRRHLRNLVALGEEDIVLYRTGNSTLPDGELEGYPAEDDLRLALERWMPDATIVANPTSMHLEVAHAAAGAGSHLLIEKPISHSMEGIEDLRDLISTEKVRVLVGFQFRYHPGLLHLKRLLDSGALGEVLSAQVTWGEYLPNWHPWEDYRLAYSARKDLGGGVVLTLCHPFDYLCWLFGDPESVTAEIDHSGVLELDVDDTADIILRFKAGFSASIHLDYLQRPDVHQLKIVAAKGTLLWDNIDGSVRWWSSEAEEWPTLWVPDGFERNKLFLDEMSHFIQVASGVAEPICPLEDGIRALEIALGALRSSEMGSRTQL